MSVVIGKVKVPVFTIELITGVVNVLFVSVSVVDLPTNVVVTEGKVKVPVFTIELITGVVNVLFVSVSVVFLPTNISVKSGNVKIRLTVCELVIVVFVDVVPTASNCICFVLSVTSYIANVESLNVN